MNAIDVSNLRRMRQQHGLSGDELARRVGITRDALYRIERGEAVPNLAHAFALAHVFGMTVDELFGAKMTH